MILFFALDLGINGREGKKAGNMLCICQAGSQVCVTGGGGKLSLQESRGAKSESLFHTSCCYNQMLIHNLRRFFLSYKDNAIVRRVQQKFPEVAKSWHPVAKSGTGHPMAACLVYAYV